MDSANTFVFSGFASWGDLAAAEADEMPPPRLGAKAIDSPNGYLIERLGRIRMKPRDLKLLRDKYHAYLGLHHDYVAHLDYAKLGEQIGSYVPTTREVNAAIEVPYLRERVTRLETELRTVSLRLAQAETAQRSSAPTRMPLDPRLAWCRDNVEKLRAYPHRYAGIVMPDGLVAVSETMRGVREQLAQKGIERSRILIVDTDDFRA